MSSPGSPTGRARWPAQADLALEPRSIPRRDPGGVRGFLSPAPWASSVGLTVWTVFAVIVVRRAPRRRYRGPRDVRREISTETGCCAPDWLDDLLMPIAAPDQAVLVAERWTACWGIGGG